MLCLLSVWLLLSPFICLYWLWQPATRFWWKHKYISNGVAIGGFLGCLVMFVAGFYRLLWFLQDSKQGFQLRVNLAAVLGFAAACGLYYRLGTDLEERLEKTRAAKFQREVLNIRQALQEGKITLPVITRRIAKMLRRADKLSPSEDIRLSALEQVWHEKKDAREFVRRIRELSDLAIKNELGPCGRQFLFDLTAEFEDAYGHFATQSLLDSGVPEQEIVDLIEAIEESEESNS